MDTKFSHLFLLGTFLNPIAVYYGACFILQISFDSTFAAQTGNNAIGVALAIHDCPSILLNESSETGFVLGCKLLLQEKKVEASIHWP
ncbi:hypothetical protein BCR43DRAFT_497210 [Syncephalastrum racemosum]|uniref:Uncharacterized protein n=1 Tax=Syncephalastrum racemosum TaxID=13706 RepID=A0A1X2H5D4_SYNRA|nr:hypothetical protein BCR43DRAFT_497210 [Syncephalastrum racemosum]